MGDNSVKGSKRFTLTRRDGATQQVERKTVRLALSAIILTFVSVSVFAVVTLPWVGTADAVEHLDYIYQVGQGHLPASTGHAWDAAGVFGDPDARQFASAHPPLWYAVGSVVAGGLLDGQSWPYAVLVLRCLNILLGVAGLLAMSYAGWTLGSRSRVEMAIALPAVGGFTFYYLRFSTEVYNDLLLTVLSLVSVLLACHVLLSGVSARLFVSLVVLCTVGMGTKATFLLTVLMCAAAVVVGGVLHRTRPLRREWIRIVAAAGILIVTPAAVFGWFYLRNRTISGSWYRSTPKSPVGDRVERSLADNLGDLDFYLIVPRSLLGRGSAESTNLAEIAAVLIFVILFVLSLVAVARGFRRGNAIGVGRILVIVFLLVHLLGSYVLQLSHATGFGAYNGRYFLPSQLTIAALLGLGISKLPRRTAVTLPLAMGALWVGNAISFLFYGVARFTEISEPGDLVASVEALTELNGVPPVIAYGSLLLATAGTVGLGIAIRWRATGPTGMPDDPVRVLPDPARDRA